MTQDDSRGDEGSIDEPNELSQGMSSFEVELDCYITTSSAQSMEDDLFEFWLQNITVFTNLSNISLHLLSVLPSSTLIEQVFQLEEKQQLRSETALLTNLEREMLMRMSDLYLP